MHGRLGTPNQIAIDHHRAEQTALTESGDIWIYAARGSTIFQQFAIDAFVSVRHVTDVVPPSREL